MNECSNFGKDGYPDALLRKCRNCMQRSECQKETQKDYPYYAETVLFQVIVDRESEFELYNEIVRIKKYIEKRISKIENSELHFTEGDEGYYEER